MISKMEVVCSACTKVRDTTTQKLGFRHLLSTLRREFQKRHLDLYLRSIRKSKLSNDEFYVNAYYDAEHDYENEVPIEVVIFHNFDSTILWNKHQITNLLIQIFDAIIHEYQHQHQSQKRLYKICWTHSNIVLQYLSDPDEIDAYALSIAIELIRSLGKQRALRHLSKFKRLSKFKIQGNFVSPNLFAFVKVFEEVDEKLLQTLLKKVYKRIQKIDTDTIFM